MFSRSKPKSDEEETGLLTAPSPTTVTYRTAATTDPPPPPGTDPKSSATASGSGGGYQQEERSPGGGAGPEPKLAAVSASHYVYYTVELFRRRQLSVLYSVWIAVLLGVVLAEGGIEEFDCLNFCNFEGTEGDKCSILTGYNSPPTCLTQWQGQATGGNGTVAAEVGEMVWRSQGQFPYTVSSTSRLFNRMVIHTPQTLISSAGPWPSVTVQLLGEETQPSTVIAEFKDQEMDTRWASVSGNIFIGLPNDYTPFPAGVRSIVLRFSSKLPVTQISGVFYMSETPWYTMGKVIVRYVVFVVGIFVMVHFLRQHAKRITATSTGRQQREDDRSSGLFADTSLAVLWRTKDHRAMALEHRLALGFHILMLIAINPFIYFVASDPTNKVWRYLADHFFPLVARLTLFGFSIGGYVVMGNLGNLGLRVVFLKSGLIASLICVPVFILDCVAAHYGDRGHPASIYADPYGLVVFVFTYVWAIVCFVLFRQRRFQMVWNSGRLGFYSGRLRVLSIWLRTVMSFMTIYIVFKTVVYYPLLLIFSQFPIYLTTNYLEAVLTTLLSSSSLMLLEPHTVHPSRAPPNPNVITNLNLQWTHFTSTAELAAARAHTSFIGIHQVDGNTGTSPGAATPEEGGLKREGTTADVFMVPMLTTRQQLAEHPMATVSALGSDQQQHPRLFTHTVPWQRLCWNEEMFTFLRKHNISGFFFLTEEEQQRFHHRHKSVCNARSFFCWETACGCLNLSSEVYKDHQGESIFIHEEGSCLEKTFARCCFPSSNEEEDVVKEDDLTAHRDQQTRSRGSSARQLPASSTSAADSERHPTTTCSHSRNHADGEISQGLLGESATNESTGPCSPSAEEKPQSPTAAPPLDVTKHGYDLYKCVNVRGVQAIICTHNMTQKKSVSDDSASKIPIAPAATTRRPSEITTEATFTTGRRPHVAIVFRGTTNASNVVTDLHFTASAWDEMALMTRKTARVHNGFLNVWTKMRQVLLSALESLFDDYGVGSSDHNNSQQQRQQGDEKNLIPLLITGHSLGGALAVLCHYSLAKGGGSSFVRGKVLDIHSYTFGMPRMGNGAFAREFSSSCVSYRIVRENDSVALFGACGRTHVGRLVVIDRDGNSCVEPNIVEEAYEALRGAGSSLRNHTLDRYAVAFDACLVAIVRRDYNPDTSSAPVVSGSERNLVAKTTLEYIGFQSYVAAAVDFNEWECVNVTAPAGPGTGDDEPSDRRRKKNDSHISNNSTAGVRPLSYS